MSTFSARKEEMTGDPKQLKQLREDAELARTRLHNARRWYESAVERLEIYDEEHGTNEADEFRDGVVISSARTTELLLQIVRDHNGKLTKEELIDAGRRAGLGRGVTEGKKRGSIGAAIELLIKAGKLKPLANGKIALS